MEIVSTFVSAVEHPSVLAPAEALGGLRLAVTAEGALDEEALERALADGPALVSVMAANNETGDHGQGTPD